MRAKIIVLGALLAITGMSLIWGAQHAGVALTNRTPTKLTCAQFAANHPDADWLILTDCEADLESVVVEHYEKARKASALYIPVHAKGGSDPAQIMIKIKIGIDPPQDADEDDLHTLANLDGEPSDKLLARVGKAFSQPIEGVIHSGIDLGEGLAKPHNAADEKDAIGKLHVGVASGFVVLDLGVKPNFWLAVIALVAGLGGAIGTVLFVRAWLRAPTHSV